MKETSFCLTHDNVFYLKVQILVANKDVSDRFMFAKYALSMHTEYCHASPHSLQDNPTHLSMLKDLK